MTTKTVYIASDGTTFDTELECLGYEKECCFNQLSPKSTFLDEDGNPMSPREFYESPDCIFGMYVPTLKDAEIIHNRCKEYGASSPWDDEAFESPGFFDPGYYWYYNRWENIDEMICYWTKMKMNFSSKGVN